MRGSGCPHTSLKNPQSDSGDGGTMPNPGETMTSNNIQITIDAVRANRRKNPTILAEATVTVAFAGHTVTVDDVRILLGKKGPWCAMPSFAIPNGKEYSYAPAVTLSASLASALEERVLKAFETWQQSQKTVNADGLEVSADDIGF